MDSNQKDKYKTNEVSPFIWSVAIMNFVENIVSIIIFFVVLWNCYYNFSVFWSFLTILNILFYFGTHIYFQITFSKRFGTGPFILRVFMFLLITTPYRFWFNILTSPFRVVPDFHIIGAQKGGSTAIVNYIYQNNVHGPLSNFPTVSAYRKETFYFTKIYSFMGKPIPGYTYLYRMFFPTIFHKMLNPNIKYFEATPSNMKQYWLPKVLKKINPKSKIVCILRNPTKRAFSQYKWEVPMRKDTEFTTSFKTLVDWEIENYDQTYKDYYNDELPDSGYPPSGYYFYDCLTRGKYVDQIKQYAKFFGKENIYVMFLENLSADPVNEMKGLFKFLDLPEIDVIPIDKSKQNKSPIEIDEYLDDEDVEKLDNYFRKYNIELAKYLNCELPENWAQ
eukprot:TRINITY_DN428_c2_g1_i1.p1 TRINITY_DN428_c2_g1~~TRINITY_DN428_c2_g1_i1.p1  ORF type:complete len:391 (+),score=83.99 TRINITY_DN428_c2_g1_i1:79-1251(+)